MTERRRPRASGRRSGQPPKRTRTAPKDRHPACRKYVLAQGGHWPAPKPRIGAEIVVDWVCQRAEMHKPRR
jgi:hypothetical protein